MNKKRVFGTMLRKAVLSLMVMGVTPIYAARNENGTEDDPNESYDRSEGRQENASADAYAMPAVVDWAISEQKVSYVLTAENPVRKSSRRRVAASGEPYEVSDLKRKALSQALKHIEMKVESGKVSIALKENIPTVEERNVRDMNNSSEVGKIAKSYEADVLFAPSYEVWTSKDKKTINVRVTGYPARFLKMRNGTKADYEVYEYFHGAGKKVVKEDGTVKIEENKIYVKE